ncbi:MAG: hypothetical protein WAZ77_12245 [Candidatus Nitrosopolaris sp.]
MSLLSRKIALSVYSRNPRTSLEMKYPLLTDPIMKGSSYLDPHMVPSSNAATNA